jgi:hypothetical protein
MEPWFIFDTIMLGHYVVALIAIIAAICFGMRKWWGGAWRALLTGFWFFLFPKVAEVIFLWPTEGRVLQYGGQLLAAAINAMVFTYWWVTIIRKRREEVRFGVPVR